MQQILFIIPWSYICNLNNLFCLNLIIVDFSSIFSSFKNIYVFFHFYHIYKVNSSTFSNSYSFQQAWRPLFYFCWWTLVNDYFVLYILQLLVEILICIHLQNITGTGNIEINFYLWMNSSIYSKFCIWTIVPMPIFPFISILMFKTRGTKTILRDMSGIVE